MEMCKAKARIERQTEIDGLVGGWLEEPVEVFSSN